LQQSAARGTGWSDKRIQAYSATLSAKLGVADLTAISGYSINTFSDDIDFTQLLGSFSQTPFGVSGWAIPENNRRISSPRRYASRLRSDHASNGYWSVFQSRSNELRGDQSRDQSRTGATAGEWGTNSFPSSFTEYAAFTDLTFQITDAFDVQLGGRESEFRQTYSETIAGNDYTLLFTASRHPLFNRRRRPMRTHSHIC